MTITKNIAVTDIGWVVESDTIDLLLEDGTITEEDAAEAYAELEADLPDHIDILFSWGGEDTEEEPTDDDITEYIMNWLMEEYGYYPEYFSWEEIE